MLLAALAVVVAHASAANAATYGTLYSFKGHPDAAEPEGALVIGSNGTLYGTTLGGGAYAVGSVFQLTKQAGQPWKETVIHSFSGSDGQYPESTLVFGSGGTIYGTTLGGNGVAGTIFQMAPPTASGGAWTLTVLHSFPYTSSDAQNFSPNGTVLISPGGTLYTTTQGPSLQFGLAIALAPPPTSGGDWTEYQIYAFPGTPNAGGPAAGVVFESGSLFGTTFTGGDEGCGDFGCGTVYQLIPGATHGTAWTASLLHTFTGQPADGSGPIAALAVGPGGVLYGTTQTGGSVECYTSGGTTGGCGTVFELIPPSASGGTWTYSIIYNFKGPPSGDGSEPVSGVVVGNNGTLYGTTSDGGVVSSACPPSYFNIGGCGTVFELTPPASPGGTWTETVLHSFSGQNGEGASPQAGLVQGSNGALYGTTSAGGTAGKGTVFGVEP